MTSDEHTNDRSGQDRGYRPRSRSDERSNNHRGYRPRDGRRSEGGRESGDRRRQDGRGYRPRGDRPSDDRRSGGDRRSFGRDSRGDGRFRGDRPRDDRRESRDEPQERPKLSIPQTVTEILHKGVDCEINGRSDLAMILYLHGTAKLNGGCENNLLRMLREAGKDQFPTIRGRLNKECPAEIMPVLDYLFSTIDKDYDAASIRTSAEGGNIYAIYCLIRMGAVEKEDELIDVFAKGLGTETELVLKGLETLSRKCSSAKAKKYLDDNAERNRLKASITTVFTRSLKGESSARKELNRLAATFPEAKFLEGYVVAVQEENGEAYLRKGARQNMPIILTYLANLKLADSPFSKYLHAKKLQSKGGQWIPAMVEAVKLGSDEAMDELEEVQNRWEVRRSLQSYYLAKEDIEGLAMGYDGKDSSYLDKYCAGDIDKILEVGELLGGNKEVDWLSKCYRNGCTACREALVSIASDRRRYGKPLLYALHDTGSDIEAARVYFDMQDDPSLPSVKWLAKVCRDEAAKEYVRSRFEEMNDLETFEFIFEDDGYVPKYKMKDSRKQGRRRF